MADLSITAANVVADDNVTIAPIKKRTGISGSAITAGELVYEQEDGDGVRRLYKADAGGLAMSLVKGIALNSAPGVNQPLVYAYDGIITLAGMTANSMYYLSDTAGKLCPAEDLGSGLFTTTIGLAVSASSLRLMINATQSQNP